MTTPDSPSVPLRLEFSVEVPGTPEQVWDAIATADGLSAWMIRTDLDERVGGVVRFHMGPEMDSTGEITGWDPPRRIEYAEPAWKDLAGQPDAPVTPLVSEFLVEAQSGGTCVIRVVSSAFGVGADWEQEFLADMERNWVPMFDHLRLYLTHFPGQHATSLQANATGPGDSAAVRSALRQALGVDLAAGAGPQIEVRGVTGTVDVVSDERVVLRMVDPVPGLLSFAVWSSDDGMCVSLMGYVYGPDAPAYVEREAPAWQSWIEELAVPAT
jgi:uncharacterized protein YndB with AHSA1/START domain